LRNWSIFAEPGEFQIYLLVAIMFLLFLNTHSKYKKIIFFILSTTVLTTLSTTAYILYFFIAILYFIHSLRYKIRSSHLIFLFVLLLFIALISRIDFISNIVFGKIFDGIENRSFGDRYYSFKFNFDIIIRYPFFGVGPEKFLILQENSTYLSAVTNTYLGVFAMFGLVPGIAFLYSIFLFVYRKFKYKALSFGIIIIFLVFLSAQEMSYSPLMNLLFLWGIFDIGNIIKRKIQ
jgi:O-antigen ligase